jgi:hypothetical protein
MKQSCGVRQKSRLGEAMGGNGGMRCEAGQEFGFPLDQCHGSPEEPPLGGGVSKGEASLRESPQDEDFS